jgi:hypothetical protein
MIILKIMKKISFCKKTLSSDSVVLSYSAWKIIEMFKSERNS